MSNQHPPGHPSTPDPLRRQLDETQRSLLRIHKAILDHERVRYEQTRGRIGGAGELLQLLIHDPWFAWLRPMSQLAAQIDEFVASKDPTDPKDGQALLAQARALLSPAEAGEEFHRRYHRSIQESPQVAMMHAQWKQSPAAAGEGEP